jgi:CDP-diacylglycerol--serine O-phosphatidyltransferase
LILELGTKQTIVPIILNKYTLLVSVFACSFLMVSELPMFSLKFKNLKLKENGLRFLFLGVIVLMMAFLQLYALPLIIVWYVLLSVISYLTTSK